MSAERDTTCEVMFYHLLSRPLERVLPPLLQKTLDRGWRALVRSGNALRLKPLSDAIWSWREESFIPHGLRADGNAEKQPILLAEDNEREAPNGADILFCVDGAMPDDADFARFERVCVLFAQADAAQVDQARALWRTLKDREDLALTYWQQDNRGRWERRG